MIERKFVTQKYNEFAIQEFISETLKNVGHSHTEVVRTPLGERIIIYASRPGLVVGRKGENIKKLTGVLKKRFGLENPQIEISEVSHPDLDAQIVAERIASTLERFGIQRFKAVGHKTLENVMSAGALGVEIKISGKVPSARAKSWRFYKGYLKKSGQLAIEGVRRAIAAANLKSGTVGVQVMILTKDVVRPDDMHVVEDSAALLAPVTTTSSAESIDASKEKSEEKSDDKKDVGEKKKRPPRKRSPRKPAVPKDAESKAESKSESKEATPSDASAGAQ